MKCIYLVVAIAAGALIIGCGGSDTSTATTTTTSSTTTGTTTTTGSTTGTASNGSYSGSFIGNYVQNSITVNYSGSGTGTIASGGAATFNYSATATNGQLLTRSFVGNIDSKGNFVGYTPQVPSGGGAVQNLAATGTVTTVSSTKIGVTLTWIWPYSNGGTFETSTENWSMTLQ